MLLNRHSTSEYNGLRKWWPYQLHWSDWIIDMHKPYIEAIYGVWIESDNIIETTINAL